MMEQNKTWDEVRRKKEELAALLENNWKNGEYHIAAIGENIIRTVDNSLTESERLIAVTNTYLDSIDKIERLARRYYTK